MSRVTTSDWGFMFGGPFGVKTIRFWCRSNLHWMRDVGQDITLPQRFLMVFVLQLRVSNFDPMAHAHRGLESKLQLRSSGLGPPRMKASFHGHIDDGMHSSQ